MRINGGIRLHHHPEFRASILGRPLARRRPIPPEQRPLHLQVTRRAAAAQTNRAAPKRESDSLKTTEAYHAPHLRQGGTEMHAASESVPTRLLTLALVLSTWRNRAKATCSASDARSATGSALPFNYCQIEATDIDLSSSGTVVVDLPAATTSTPDLLVLGGGKRGNFYLLDREHMPGGVIKRHPCSWDPESDSSPLGPEPQPNFSAHGLSATQQRRYFDEDCSAVSAVERLCGSGLPQSHRHCAQRIHDDGHRRRRSPSARRRTSRLSTPCQIRCERAVQGRLYRSIGLLVRRKAVVCTNSRHIFR